MVDWKHVIGNAACFGIVTAMTLYLERPSEVLSPIPLIAAFIGGTFRYVIWKLEEAESDNARVTKVIQKFTGKLKMMVLF